MSHFAKLGTVTPNPRAPPWTASSLAPQSPGDRGPGSMAAFPRTPLTAVLEQLVGPRLEARGTVCQLGPGRSTGGGRGPFTPSVRPRTPVVKSSHVGADPLPPAPRPEPWDNMKGHMGFPESRSPQASEEGVPCGLEGERLVPEAPKAASDGSSHCWCDTEGQEGTGPPRLSPACLGAGGAGGRERGLLGASPARRREGGWLWSRKR